jgi:hypothetical protein
MLSIAMVTLEVACRVCFARTLKPTMTAINMGHVKGFRLFCLRCQVKNKKSSNQIWMVPGLDGMNMTSRRGCSREFLNTIGVESIESDRMAGMANQAVGIVIGTEQ